MVTSTVINPPPFQGDYILQRKIQSPLLSARMSRLIDMSHYLVVHDKCLLTIKYFRFPLFHGCIFRKFHHPSPMKNIQQYCILWEKNVSPRIVNMSHNKIELL